MEGEFFKYLGRRVQRKKRRVRAHKVFLADYLRDYYDRESNFKVYFGKRIKDLTFLKANNERMNLIERTEFHSCNYVSIPQYICHWSILIKSKENPSITDHETNICCVTYNK